jgi:hypothetical protein
MNAALKICLLVISWASAFGVVCMNSRDVLFSLSLPLSTPKDVQYLNDFYALKAEEIFKNSLGKISATF